MGKSYTWKKPKILFFLSLVIGKEGKKKKTDFGISPAVSKRILS